MADKREILLSLLGRETVSTAAAKAGKGLDKLGDQFDQASDDARRLDDEIGQAEQSLKELAQQFARTQDQAERLDLSKAMRKQQTELRRLTRTRALLGDDKPLVSDQDTRKTGLRLGARLAANIADGLATAGGPISKALGNVFGSLPPQAQVAIGAAVVAGVASAAPLIGGVLAGAVVGGIGVGGVVGGVAIAARHPEVKAAATATGQAFTAAMERAGAAFVPATVDALGLVRAELHDMEDDLQRVFGKSAKYLRPLTQGVAGFVRELLPGIEAAVDKAGPIINELASWGPKLGRLLSDVFTQFSEHSYEASRALAAFWVVLDSGVRNLAQVVTSLTVTYGLLERLGAMLNRDVVGLAGMDAAQAQAAASGDDLAGSLQGIIDGFAKTGDAAGDATGEVESFSAAMDRMTRQNFDVERSTMALEEAIDRATEAVARNGRTADKGTQKGRDNRAALLAIAQAANEASAAIYAQTHSQEQADAVLARAREQFMRLAASMNIATADAKALADQLFTLPSPTVKVTAETAAANRAIAEVTRNLAGVKSKNVTIGVWWTSKGDLKLPGGTSIKGAATGGPITGAGPQGVDSVPMMLAPGEHVLTAREVEAAGGHGVIQRWRQSLLSPQSPSQSPSAGAAPTGGGGTSTLRIVLEWPDGRVIKDLLVDAASLRGQTPGRYLGIT